MTISSQCFGECYFKRPAVARPEFTTSASRSRNSVADIYEAQPLPIMQSPLIGKTLAELAKAAGGGVAFYSMFPHPGPGEIAIFFLLLGGTRIILGASDGIAFALKHGLSHLLLKWMGVPQPKIPPIKEKD